MRDRCASTGRFLPIVPIDRFLPNVRVEESGCWIWTATLDRDGYGQIGINGKNVRAHRFSYEYFIGPISKGLTIDHLCRVRNCVNPDHLEPVTNAVNIRRGDGWGGLNHRKTHCKNGHPFDEANTYMMKLGRSCRLCRNDARARHAEKVRGPLTVTPLPKSLKDVK